MRSDAAVRAAVGHACLTYVSSIAVTIHPPGQRARCRQGLDERMQFHPSRSSTPLQQSHALQIVCRTLIRLQDVLLVLSRPWSLPDGMS
jgi:hypothetical protein